MDERGVGSITLQAITKDPSITIRPPDWTPRNINTSNRLWMERSRISGRTTRCDVGNKAASQSWKLILTIDSESTKYDEP